MDSFSFLSKTSSPKYWPFIKNLMRMQVADFQYFSFIFCNFPRNKIRFSIGRFVNIVNLTHLALYFSANTCFF